MLIVLALCAFYAINIFVSVVTILGTLVFNGTLERLMSLMYAAPLPDQEFMQEMFLENLPVGLASIAGIVAGSFALLIVRGKRLFTEDLSRVNQRMVITDLMKMMALILGFNAAVSLAPLFLEMLLQLMNIPPVEGELDITDAYMNLPGILYVVILGPLFEEVMFRGAILRSLQPYGNNFAIVVSSILFGAYHLALTQGVFAFFVGLVLAYCALRFSIKWSLLLHVTNNAIAMAITYANVSLLSALGIYFLFLVLASIAGVLGFQKFREQMRTGKPTSIAFVLGMPDAGAVAPGAPYGMGAPVAPVAPQPLAPGVPVTPTAPQAKPFAITFTSAWLIVALSLAFIISALTQFFM